MPKTTQSTDRTTLRHLSFSVGCMNYPSSGGGAKVGGYALNLGLRF